jgi:hypothetical protein
VLHVFYGPESFLYSGHWLPLLIVVAAFATLGPARRMALALVALLMVCAAVNNVSEFERAVAQVQREAVAQAGGILGDAGHRVE